MRRVGSSSWVLAEDTSQQLHFALYVRDAAGLPVAPAAGVPTALAERPAPIELPDGSDRDALAAEWTTWWRRLVRHETVRPEGDAGAALAGGAGAAAVAEAEVVAGSGRTVGAAAGRRGRPGLFDPPRFDSLSDLPGLRALAVEHHRVGLRWCQAVRPEFAHGLVPHELVPYALVKRAAEEVIAAYEVPPGDVTGRIIVLAVEGRWAHSTGDGSVLCSTAAATDPDVVTGLLWDVFTSGLERGPGDHL